MDSESFGVLLTNILRDCMKVAYKTFYFVWFERESFEMNE
jgi:hypothetical protein